MKKLFLDSSRNSNFYNKWQNFEEYIYKQTKKQHFTRSYQSTAIC